MNDDCWWLVAVDTYLMAIDSTVAVTTAPTAVVYCPIDWWLAPTKNEQFVDGCSSWWCTQG